VKDSVPRIRFAVCVPAEVMRLVDLAAEERGITRSRFISELLRRVASARSDQDISRQVDEALSDAGLAGEQRATSAAYGRIRPRSGTEW
jgi:hypothetical protein